MCAYYYPSSSPWPVSPRLQHIQYNYQLMRDLQIIELQKQSFNMQVAQEQARVAAQQKALRHQLRHDKWHDREVQSAHLFLGLSKWAMEHPEDAKQAANLLFRTGQRILGTLTSAGAYPSSHGASSNAKNSTMRGGQTGAQRGPSPRPRPAPQGAKSRKPGTGEARPSRAASESAATSNESAWDRGVSVNIYPDGTYGTSQPITKPSARSAAGDRRVKVIISPDGKYRSVK